MSDILPITNLDDYEIRDTLNKYGGVTDNDFGSKFRKTAKINKWSFYKPVNHENLFSLTDQDFYDVNDGFEYTEYTSFDDLAIDLTNNNVWRYNPITKPFRMGDFRGYDPDAKEWFLFTTSTRIQPQTILINVSSGITSKLELFSYWKHKIPTSSGLNFLSLLLYSSNNKYTIPITDMANIVGGEVNFALTMDENNEIPSGNYQAALGIGEDSRIGMLIDAEMPFYCLSDSWTDIKIQTAESYGRELFQKIDMSIESVSYDRYSEGGGFYTYEVYSAVVSIKNNNTNAGELGLLINALMDSYANGEHVENEPYSISPDYIKINDNDNLSIQIGFDSFNIFGGSSATLYLKFGIFGNAFVRTIQKGLV